MNANSDLLTLTVRQLAERGRKGDHHYEYAGAGYAMAAAYLATLMPVSVDEAFQALKGAAPFGLRFGKSCAIVTECIRAYNEALAHDIAA